MRKQLYSLYVLIKLLTANTFRLLFTYNADSIRDLTCLGSLRTLTKSVLIFRCFPNTAPFYKRCKQILGESRSLDLNCCTQQANL